MDHPARVYDLFNSNYTMVFWLSSPAMTSSDELSSRPIPLGAHNFSRNSSNAVVVVICSGETVGNRLIVDSQPTTPRFSRTRFLVLDFGSKQVNGQILEHWDVWRRGTSFELV
ncbi:hypothetical protein R6Q59_006425 [Mikania micrantha]